MYIDVFFYVRVVFLYVSRNPNSFSISFSIPKSIFGCVVLYVFFCCRQVFLKSNVFCIVFYVEENRLFSSNICLKVEENRFFFHLILVSWMTNLVVFFFLQASLFTYCCSNWCATKDNQCSCIQSNVMVRLI